jgi:hypothetical protein
MNILIDDKLIIRNYVVKEEIVYDVETKKLVVNIFIDCNLYNRIVKRE